MLDIRFIAKKLANDDLQSTDVYKLCKTKPDDFYVVWECRTSQIWKVLVRTDIVPTSFYFEITYNCDKKEFCVDRYILETSKCVRGIKC